MSDPTVTSGPSLPDPPGAQGSLHYMHVTDGSGFRLDAYVSDGNTYWLAQAAEPPEEEDAIAEARAALARVDGGLCHRELPHYDVEAQAGTCHLWSGHEGDCSAWLDEEILADHLRAMLKLVDWLRGAPR